MEIWRALLKMDIDYTLSALDLPSHHKSDYFPELFLKLYVDVLNEFIEYIKVKEVILCGHSLGGAIIQLYYFTYPEKVKALILCGTGGRLRVSPTILNALKNNYQEYLDSLNLAFHKKTSEEIIDAYRTETSKIGAQVTYQDFKICDAFDTLEKTHTIKVPSLIMCGDSDMLTPPKYSKYLQEKIKNSHLVIIKEAGHMLMLEKPKEVIQVIENFLKNEIR